MEVAGNIPPFLDTSFIRTKIQCNVYKRAAPNTLVRGVGLALHLLTDFIEDMWFHYWGEMVVLFCKVKSWSWGTESALIWHFISCDVALLIKL